MSSQHKKRLLDPTSSTTKRHHHHHHHHHSPPLSPLPSFPSFLQTPNLPPKIQSLCQIISSSSSPDTSLTNSPIPISSDDVEQVLKLSYSHPAAAVNFFRWAGPRLPRRRHSPYSWNLVVDLLGKNRLFDAMWDAVRSMKSEGLISLATFASIFSSFAAAGRFGEAVDAFESMVEFGVSRDVAALNSLLSALSREGLTAAALDCFRGIRGRIAPDEDSYAVLLEGFENEGNFGGAREVFDEMIVRFGWDPSNVPAYDSFLNAVLCCGERGGLDESLRWMARMKEHGCFPGARFLGNAIDECVRVGDGRLAILLWDSLVGRNECLPDTEVCNSMISLYCNLNQLETAYRFFDDMVIYGAFPDSRTYNLMLQLLIKSKKLQDVLVLLREMVKNEFVPSSTICDSAMSLLMDSRDWETALDVWRIMIENGIGGEQIGNLLIVGLRDHNMLPEACKYAEGMIEKGIKLQSSTLSKLRISLLKLGKEPLYDDILRKWKMVSSDRVL